MPLADEELTKSQVISFINEPRHVINNNMVF